MADRGDIRWEGDSYTEAVKTCIKCTQTLPLSSFRKRKVEKDGHHYYCKPCVKSMEQSYREARPEILEANRAWKANNPERVKEHRKDFWNSNPEANRVYEANKRARKWKAEGTLEVSEWLEVLDKHGKVCLKCGSTEHIQMDHVIPFAKGGKNTKDNLQPLCEDCNKRKKVNIEDYR